jgi:Na+-translocating ferredoxin:NAD+ oxidoreductase RnfC subunit
MIVYDITKRIVPQGGIPLEVGVVVSNVATMLNIYDSLNGVPVIEKYLTVAGEVNNPSVLKVPVGISFKECIAACGGAKRSSFKVINGGPMMGKVYNQDELEKLVVTKVTSGIIITKDKGNFIANIKDTDIKKFLNRAKSVCIQCSFCTQLCPRALIGHSLRPHLIMRRMASIDIDRNFFDDAIFNEALSCCECGVCETYACPMNLSPRQINKHIKDKFKGKKFESDTQTYAVVPHREYKKIAPAKIMMRMGLNELYRNKNLEYKELSTGRVVLPLKQHIGIPAAPCVEVGQYVEKGQLIASGEIDKVSANVHASIAGKVVGIDDAIEINGVI